MKCAALITEYNPFHNGHAYHVEQARQIANADVTVAIMSGQFVMRGQPAIYNKFLRTQMALSSCDLVVELPAFAALSAGEYFAEMGVKVADYLNCDALVFGSESGSIKDFEHIALQLNHIEEHPEFQTKQREGKSYPRIINELLGEPHLLQTPNNILSLSYVQAINNFAPNMTPYTIKRHQSQHHHPTISHRQFASGTAIRKSLENEDRLFESVVPAAVKQLYNKPHLTVEDCFPYLKYAILRASPEELQHIHTVSEGFEHRLKAQILHSQSFDQLMSQLKTKRYTYTRIQRMLMNILLNFKQAEKQDKVSAVRILGMNEKGQAYLKSLKQQFPDRHYITNVNQSTAPYFKHEIQATTIYNWMSGETQDDFNTPVIRVQSE
ncbi:nucleotidyltransferase [Staphylococcus sp. EZ-P03]|uniref:nucleotidyltransferase n=1 Tax=Staphylococcus sp. EZ-P03 TaxID=2282739 RepID=UPI000DF7B95D|nr:nucleotidyltransferase [Staphylococcus sp. EZ-P03]